MNLSLTWLNCFWLSLPLLAWNLLLGSKLTQEQIASAAHSPAWLLGAENVFRLATFSLPLFLRLQLDSNLGKIGLAVYLLGRLVYFASWILLIWAPQAAWSQSLPGLFAPPLDAADLADRRGAAGQFLALWPFHRHFYPLPHLAWD
jgi:hypothetical protein